jgi:ferredoxin-NADP reductase
MAGTYSVSLLESQRLCEGTGSFRFACPIGYRFDAGQYFALTLETVQGPQTADFSHSSAPLDPYIELTTRLTGSAFKTALEALSTGDLVTVAGPYGRLTVPPGVTRAGFLVGGVGVTPCRSIVRDAVQRSTRLEALVFDGNLDQSCVPFRDEFDAYEREHEEIRFVHVLEHPLEPWDGDRGFVTADIVRRHCDPLDGRHWFVAGPPAMVQAMETVVADLGLPPERVSWELFSGHR